MCFLYDICVFGLCVIIVYLYLKINTVNILPVILCLQCSTRSRMCLARLSMKAGSRWKLLAHTSVSWSSHRELKPRPFRWISWDLISEKTWMTQIKHDQYMISLFILYQTEVLSTDMGAPEGAGLQRCKYMTYSQSHISSVLWLKLSRVGKRSLKNNNHVWMMTQLKQGPNGPSALLYVLTPFSLLRPADLDWTRPMVSVNTHYKLLSTAGSPKHLNNCVVFFPLVETVLTARLN